LPCELPGDVALIFGIKQSNCIWSSALEWSPIEIETPVDYGGIPWTGEMPIAYQGVIHRTEQFTDAEIAEPVFESLGYKNGGWNLQSIQATSIGAFANLPQGWPFDEDEGCTLIATLSSFYFGRKWPLCDVPAGLNYASADGRILDMCGDTARDFSIGDAGCIWIYRDSSGEFHLDEACG